jgi:hypothetical protein
MTSRFDLEQGILDCWTVVDTLKQIGELTEQIKDPVVADEMMNVILGAAAIYQMKFERLFDQYEEVIRNDDLPIFTSVYDI